MGSAPQAAPGGPALTHLLLLWDAHNPHGLHGLLEHVLVLLPGDGDVPVGQEAVFVVWLQQEISCGGQRARFREGQEVLEPDAPVNTVTSKVWETGERPEIPQKPRSDWKGPLPSV